MDNHTSKYTDKKKDRQEKVKKACNLKQKYFFFIYEDDMKGKRCDCKRSSKTKTYIVYFTEFLRKWRKGS